MNFGQGNNRVYAEPNKARRREEPTCHCGLHFVSHTVRERVACRKEIYVNGNADPSPWPDEAVTT